MKPATNLIKLPLISVDYLPSPDSITRFFQVEDGEIGMQFLLQKLSDLLIETREVGVRAFPLPKCDQIDQLSRKICRENDKPETV